MTENMLIAYVVTIWALVVLVRALLAYRTAKRRDAAKAAAS